MVAGPQEALHRLCPDYATDINSPLRHVRTRIYFTSESHVHSLINVLRFCHVGAPPAPPFRFHVRLTDTARLVRWLEEGAQPASSGSLQDRGMWAQASLNRAALVPGKVVMQRVARRREILFVPARVSLPESAQDLGCHAKDTVEEAKASRLKVAYLLGNVYLICRDSKLS